MEQLIAATQGIQISQEQIKTEIRAATASQERKKWRPL
jgi:hypothetical protein